jgi:hypothetical protein
MCNECAFRKSCDTWKEPRNRLASQIAAAGPFPFFCHAKLDWTNPLTHALPARTLAAAGGRVCEGWKQAVAARKWPDTPALRWYQRWLASIALKTAERFIAGRVSVRELHRDLAPLAEFYKGPRAWQIARML